MEKRNCPICFAPFTKKIFEQTFSFGEIEDFDQKIEACENCNFVGVSEYLSQDELKEYYKINSTYEYIESLSDFKAEQLRSDQQFDYITNIIPNISSVYDVGAATGYFLSLFKGYDTGGTEPSPKQRTLAKTFFDLELDSHFVGSDTILQKKYDLITLSHVLEHIFDINSMLKFLKNSLNSNGYIFIEVPVIDYFGDEDLFQFSFEHVNYFSSQSLLNLMNTFGFTLVSMKKFANDKGQCPHYPTLASVWQYNGQKHGVLDTYVKSVMDYRNKINSKIDLVRRSELNCEIAIYGSGTLAAQLFEFSPLVQIKNLKIIDGNTDKHGKIFNGIEILSPNILKDKSTNWKVIITSYSSRHEINRFLTQFKNVEVIDIF